MADNTLLNLGTGGDTIRDIDRGTGAKTQVVQLDFGGAAGNAESLASATNPLPVTPAAPVFQNTTAALAAGASWTSTAVNTVSGGTFFSFSAYSATNLTIWIQESPDNTNWYNIDPYYVTGPGSNYSTHKAGAQYVRFQVTNTGTANNPGGASLLFAFTQTHFGAETDVQQAGNWYFAPDGVNWGKTGTSANVNLTNGITHNGPQPVYLDDQNTTIDDNGNQIVSIDTSISDVATQSTQVQVLSAVQQMVALEQQSLASTGSVNVLSAPVPGLAVNASQELNGQIQRIADLMEAVLIELRTLNAVTASLGQPSPEDPDRVRTDINLTLQ